VPCRHSFDFVLLWYLSLCTVDRRLKIGLPSRTFGGFFYDRALGRPVTLDIGFGPFKTRLLGPTEEIIAKRKEENELVDLSSPLTVLVVLTSGAVQLVGKVSGVSTKESSNHGIKCMHV
jgi:hypothetical protein